MPISSATKLKEMMIYRAGSSGKTTLWATVKYYCTGGAWIPNLGLGISHMFCFVGSGQAFLTPGSGAKAPINVDIFEDY